MQALSDLKFHSFLNNLLLMLTSHFALIDQSKQFNSDQVNHMAAICNLQLKEDFFPIWKRPASMTAASSLSTVPKGFWPVIIKNDIGEPGALGFHTDENNQPIAYVSAMDGNMAACLTTISHEVIETVLDPWGNRLLQNILHPINNTERVQWLCEGCDPPEAITYLKNGLPVSDFLCPEYFDDARGQTSRLTYLNSISACRTIIPGGYASFIGADGKWYQITWFDGPQAVLAGPFNWKAKPGQSLREMVDFHTNARRASK